MMMPSGGVMQSRKLDIVAGSILVFAMMGALTPAALAQPKARGPMAPVSAPVVPSGPAAPVAPEGGIPPGPDEKQAKRRPAFSSPFQQERAPEAAPLRPLQGMMDNGYGSLALASALK